MPFDSLYGYSQGGGLAALVGAHLAAKHATGFAAMLISLLSWMAQWMLGSWCDVYAAAWRQNGFTARSVKIVGLDSVWSASTWADSCHLMRCTATCKALVLQFWWALILQPNMLQAWRPCCWHGEEAIKPDNLIVETSDEHRMNPHHDPFLGSLSYPSHPLQTDAVNPFNTGQLGGWKSCCPWAQVPVAGVGWFCFAKPCSVVGAKFVLS